MNINVTLIGQMGTFLVFWWFVNKVIWPMFANIATERQRKIADGLNMADKAKFAVQEAEHQSQEILSKAKMQAAEIVSRANKEASEMIAQAKEQAQRSSEAEVLQAHVQIEQEKRQVRDELRAQLSHLVIAGAEKVLGREVNDRDHERLLHELTEKF
ncbi:F0F1 ATP synthase subunit B [Dichelobacter nodosus]|uniref:ATP synthase subunit b n=1 Tax=Dichelobacter nodosus (strain VCS1703A) TaxID=246195 RepID=ATPF_DICNV|nr:F0F1 ATP synthase subunit B [Dichelobacter nodosus]A5EXJ9.1 RecName: Full=ATP synthase subunit b; AltName: Full=ATP synthase F(0) sector subunit b; AltName: Full=ATPase subunit I; AltName: Full=F-type ATPase subunit b; Short=F-ATPase subunit b [Dichelobacter nodosus VCS1703A]ABQ14220.1 ATP synthase F0, B subunit [Dichelobacter nodosus VCS1703A]AXM45921.1 F0F1 ATP synthase subunit B [Dichelobacter nodosus]KNZ39088.1 ATP synthase subunit B [Dichelobacter nodosus]TGA64626.1 F0F1 ATP synthase s